MAVYRIRKRLNGGFSVVGTLGGAGHLLARDVQVVETLEEAAKVISAMAEEFAVVRHNPSKNTG